MKQWQRWFLGIIGGMLFMGGSLFFLIACSSPANTSNANSHTPVSTPNIEQTERALDVAWINTYASDIRQKVAQGLHLSIDQLRTQLQAGQTLSQIATAQRLTPVQLQTLELQAVRDVGQKAVRAGVVPQAHVDQFLHQAQSDTVYLDEIITGIFIKQEQKS
jgi:hypothetical protein